MDTEGKASIADRKKFLGVPAEAGGTTAGAGVFRVLPTAFSSCLLDGRRVL